MGTLTTAIDYAVAQGDYSSPPDVSLVPSTHLGLAQICGDAISPDSLGLREVRRPPHGRTAQSAEKSIDPETPHAC